MARCSADVTAALEPALLLLVCGYLALVPWEISKALIPVLRTETVGARSVSVLDASRLVAGPILVLAALFVRTRRTRSAVAIAAVTLTVFGLAAMHSPDPGGARTEVVRLALNLGVMVAAAGVASPDGARRMLAWFRRSMVLAGALLVILAAAGAHLWNSELGSRANGPFADPNIAGRFLVVGLVIAVGDLTAGSSDRRVFAKVGGVAVLGAGILATGSRSAWLAAIVLAVVAALAPTYRLVQRAAVRSVVVGAPIAFGALLLLPSLLARVSTFLGPGGGLGSRPSLVRAGLVMWRDHPLFGLGLSGYDVGILDRYAAYQGYYGSAQTASHTSIVTTMADLGLVGLALLAFIGGAMLASLQRWRDEPWRLSAPAFSAAAGVLVVFLSSQSEGRFWEEPMLWPLLGIVLAAPRRGCDG